MRCIQATHSEIVGFAQPDTMILVNLLDTMMRELQRALHPRDNPAIPRQFLDVKGYLEAHFQRPQRLADLADRTCLSIPHFCAQFKRFFGMSAIDYLVRLRMQHAGFLLRDMSTSVTQVAETVGYADLYYFSRLFKKHHGASPRHYRTRMKRGDTPRRTG
jgi:iron complex transport system substrate-binding protein